MNGRPIKIIDCSGNPELVSEICSFKGLERAWAKTNISSFSDGEVSIEILENVRGTDIYAIQSAGALVNTSIMQLLLILDALKRSNCWRVTAVIPYLPYARQDAKLKPRVPISARAVADLIQAMGVDRILTMDLHSNQIQGYFSCAIDNLFSSIIFLEHMMEHLEPGTVIVSPDVGGATRALHYAKRLELEAAIIHKTRIAANKIGRMVLLGHVRDQTSVLVDDMADTCGTLCSAAEVLKDAGSKKIIAYVGHGIFSGNAFEKIENSVFDKVYVTDSIAQDPNRPAKIEVISCAALFAKAITNIHKETSVSELFDISR